MNITKKIISALFLLLMGTVTAFPQQKLKFSVTGFDYDAFDTTAKDDRHKKVDGSGSLYAIIKVTGNPDEDLREYNFNFGNMNSFVEDHDDQLWVYVQKNAKMVTISRNGYTTLRNYDLHTTIEAGKTYKMVLSAQGPKIYTQMLMFKISPADSKAVVMMREEGSNSKEKMLGIVDASGVVAKNMPFGTYTYTVISVDYNPSEGRITLNNQEETYQEEVTLRPRFSMITLMVNGDAEIYVNGESKGSGSWTGRLNAGVYQVECRSQNHRSSTQNITVEEDTPRTFELTPPTPIVGTLSVISSPVGASIQIDGRDYGTTPRNVTGLLIGQHEVMLSLDGYDDTKATVEVKENETAELYIKMEEEEEEDVFEVVEQNPEFPGGTEELMKWMSKNLRYSAAAQENGIQGRVLVQFVVDKDGSIVEPKVIRSVDPALDKEALRVVSVMPRWQPGKHRGKPVSVRFTLPVTFRLIGAEDISPLQKADSLYKEQDYSGAFEIYQRLAQQGNAEAQYKLGLCYRTGRGVSRDYKKAVYWYEKSANQGNDVAQFNLGYCYYSGRGVSQDYKKAVYWYEKSANQGNAEAQYSLGWCYEHGNGVSQDLKKAVEWYEKSANQGYAWAQYTLGLCYGNGKGVSQDYKKAVELLEKAANQGFVNAQNSLRIFYENGRGVSKDLKKAAYSKKKYEENPNK